MMDSVCLKADGRNLWFPQHDSLRSQCQAHAGPSGPEAEATLPCGHDQTDETRGQMKNKVVLWVSHLFPHGNGLWNCSAAETPAWCFSHRFTINTRGCSGRLKAPSLSDGDGWHRAEECLHARSIIRSGSPRKVMLWEWRGQRRMDFNMLDFTKLNKLNIIKCLKTATN